MGLSGTPDGINGAELAQFYIGMVEPAKLLSTARAMSSTLIQFGCGTNYFKAKLSNSAFEASEKNYGRVDQGTEQQQARIWLIVECIDTTKNMRAFP